MAQTEGDYWSVEFQRDVVRKLGFDPETFNSQDDTQSNALALAGVRALLSIGKSTLDERSFIANYISGRPL